MEIRFYSGRNKTDFHMKAYALSLPVTMRFTATRQWPIMLVPGETEYQNYVATAWHRSSPSLRHSGSKSGYHGEDSGGTGWLSALNLRYLSRKTDPGSRTYTSAPGLFGPDHSVGCPPRSYNLPCTCDHSAVKRRIKRKRLMYNLTSLIIST